MWKREYVDDDDDYVVRDGESVRCSVLLMDAMQRKIAGVDLVDLSDHRPHFLTDTMDVRRIARDARSEYVAKLVDAWRSPPNVSLPAEWRRHQRGAPGPDDDPGDAMLRGHLQTERGESQRRRDAAWNSYKDQLSRAWRQGRTDPSR